MTGNILIIGEQSGDKLSDRPFCAETHSSKYINEKLNVYDIPEEKLYWVNALRCDDSEADINSIVVHMNPSVVICLGNIAERTCKNQGINNYIKFYHPQYWKRFRNKEEYPFVLKLVELLNEIKTHS
jgi:hypothetical protein